MSAKKILVTGGTGFLGTILTNQLKSAGNEVVALGSRDCDLRKQGALERLGLGKFDLIFHLAAWTQAGDFCLHHAGEQWIINQEINTNVLAWWQAEQSQAKLVAIGSSCCYEPGTPHIEERYLVGQPIESLYTYAMTKRMLYTGLLALNKQFGLRYLFLVPNTLYGPGYHLDGRQMHFIFDLMRKIVAGKQHGEEVVLWGDGSQARELVYAEDFVKAASLLADSVDNEIVNIGSGVEYPIKHYAELLSELIGFDVQSIKYDTTKYTGADSKVLIVDKLKRLLPEYKPTDLKAGLSKIVDWYSKNL